MRISWKAVVLAPLPVPLVTGLLFAMAPSPDPLFSFLFFFAPGCLGSYGVTLLLFLPCLFVLSRFTILTAGRTGLLGLLLGGAVYFPIGWQSYLISGDNSGHPSQSFAHYLWHDSWSESWVFCLGGLLTATLYWLLSTPTAGKSLETAHVNGQGAA